MEIVDDVIETVACYTNPQVTWSLMLMDPRLSGKVYTPSFWRNKCIKETCGLMVKDELVTADSQMGWYAYYVMRNRTSCGIPRVVINACEIKTIYDEACIAAIKFGVRHNTHLVQLPDYSIRFVKSNGNTSQSRSLQLSSCLIESCNILSSCGDHDDYGLDVTIMLLANGDVVVYDHLKSNQYTLVTDVVDMEYPLLLSRTGRVAYASIEYVENALTGKIIMTHPTNRDLSKHTNIIKLYREDRNDPDGPDGEEIDGVLLNSEGSMIAPGDVTNTPINRYDYDYSYNEDGDGSEHEAQQSTFIANCIAPGFKAFPDHTGDLSVTRISSYKEIIRYITTDRLLHTRFRTFPFKIQREIGEIDIVICDT